MEKPTAEIMAADPLAETRWLRLFRVGYRLADRANRTWMVATRNERPRCVTGRFETPDAVMIVAYHRATSRIVVTREYRVALADYQYGFPTGLLEDRETVEDTARRELREETGFEMIKILKVSQPLYSSAGMTDESMSMVYVECEGEPSNQSNVGSEIIEVLLLSPDEAGCLCDNPFLKFDAKSWLVITQFAATGHV